MALQILVSVSYLDFMNEVLKGRDYTLAVQAAGIVCRTKGGFVKVFGLLLSPRLVSAPCKYKNALRLSAKIYTFGVSL